MYERYHGVLRFLACRGADGKVRLWYDSLESVPFLQKKCGWLGLGEWKKIEAGGVCWEWHNMYALSPLLHTTYP